MQYIYIHIYCIHTLYIYKQDSMRKSPHPEKDCAQKHKHTYKHMHAHTHTHKKKSYPFGRGTHRTSRMMREQQFVISGLLATADVMKPRAMLTHSSLFFSPTPSRRTELQVRSFTRYRKMYSRREGSFA